MAGSLAKKLAEVMQAVDRIPKRGENTHFGYTYATEADVADAVRQELAKRNVAFLPAVLPETIRIDAVGKQTILTAVFEFTFVDGETGEKLTVRTIGQGQDSGDKAGYKAMTGAEKYALMKTFLIPTGDDPEKDDEPKAPQSKPQETRTTRNARQTPAPTGDKEKALEHLHRLAESRGLDADDLDVLAYVSFELISHTDASVDELRSIYKALRKCSDEELHETLAAHRERYNRAREEASVA